jgi:hypothetical protein
MTIKKKVQKQVIKQDKAEPVRQKAEPLSGHHGVEPCRCPACVEARKKLAGQGV